MSIRKLRWVMDGGGFWDLDISSPQSLDGLAFPVPGDPLPLGTPTTPIHPSFHAYPSHSLLLHTLRPLSPSFVFLLGQFNLQRFLSSVKSTDQKPKGLSSWFKTFGRHLQHKSLYSLGFSSEFQLGQDDTLLFGFDAYGHSNKPRGKTVFHHKFPHHDLTVEAVYPGLFVDKTGNYWDVPFSMAVDLASVTTSDSSTAYHLTGRYNSGSPKQFENIQNLSDRVPPTLLPGLAFKSAFSYRRKVDIWRSEAPKMKLVPPYDIFLSNPHVSASGIIGAAATTAFGDNSARAQAEDGRAGFFLQASGIKSSFLADIFASISFTAQYGNFQGDFLDLSRFQACLDFPSGFKFLSGATSITQDLLNSQKPSMEAVQAILPNATLSLQQQIFGPVSFRVDSGIRVDLTNPEWPIHAQEPVFALEYALQVLGSAKAVAWYCPKRQEFMAELRFYET
ncbi:Protein TRIGALACTOSYLDIACYLGLYCEROL 4, chloroplastic, partial [Mucuna pruriens]